MKKMLAYVGLMFLVVAATGHTVAAQNQLNFSNTAFSTTDVRAARAFRFVWRGFQFIGADAGDSRGVVECALQRVEGRERIRPGRTPQVARADSKSQAGVKIAIDTASDKLYYVN